MNSQDMSRESWGICFPLEEKGRQRGRDSYKYKIRW
jgi:hypothetical protein